MSDEAPSVQDEMNELLNGAVEVASELLAKESEFLPFALALATDGEVFHIEPEDDDLSGDEAQVVATLREGLREEALSGRWKAIAVVADVTLEDESGEAMTSAIHITMEHADGDPVNCTVPYAIEGEELELDDLFAEPGETVVFEKRPVN
ncbi:MAG: hypothetical protein AB7S26_30915 [Sandaracinaceae bacterium]